MKKYIIKFFKKLFNDNTGYFYTSIIYYYEGRVQIGYGLYRGYVMFGLSGHTLVSVYVDKKDMLKDMELLVGTK